MSKKIDKTSVNRELKYEVGVCQMFRSEHRMHEPILIIQSSKRLDPSTILLLEALALAQQPSSIRRRKSTIIGHHVINVPMKELRLNRDSRIRCYYTVHDLGDDGLKSELVARIATEYPLCGNMYRMMQCILAQLHLAYFGDMMISNA